MVRAQVHSTTHYVQLPINQIATGLRETNTIVFAVDKQAVNLSTEVEEGSSIKAVYFEMWLQNESNLGEFIATISKQTDQGVGPTFVQMATLFTYTNKKNILWTSQGLTSNDGISGPVNIIRGWVKIPKSKQRFGLGDVLTLNISNVSANDLVRCGIAIYKEYR